MARGPLVQFSLANYVISTFKCRKRSTSSSTRYRQHSTLALFPQALLHRGHRKTPITYYFKAMSLLRNTIKSSVSLRTIKPINSLPPLLRQSPKHFTTETEASPPPPPAASDPSIDLFLQTPNNGTKSIAFWLFCVEIRVYGLGKKIMHLGNFIIYMNLFCLTKAVCLFIYLVNRI